MERALREKLVGGSFGKVSETHSRRMRAIRGKGNRTTERRFRALLIQAGIRGWTLQTQTLPGKPDFFFPKQKVAIFVDGCFWHGCPRCGHVPKVNRPYWSAKIIRNQERDRQKDQQLEERGVRVLRLWEHEVQQEGPMCLARLRTLLVCKPPLP